MSKTKRNSQLYRVKVLDCKYLSIFDQLSFWYLTYEVNAKNEKDAKLYLEGHKEMYTERDSKFGISSCVKIPADQRSQTTPY